MKQKNAVIGIYDTHDKAEEAVKQLEKSGFDMKKLPLWVRITTPRNTSLATTMLATA